MHVSPAATQHSAAQVAFLLRYEETRRAARLAECTERAAAGPGSRKDDQFRLFWTKMSRCFKFQMVSFELN